MPQLQTRQGLADSPTTGRLGIHSTLLGDRIMKTVQEICNTGYCLPGKACYFIDHETERKIAARLVHWHGPGWYSYDGSMYRIGREPAYSQIQLERGHARSGGVVESGY